MNALRLFLYKENSAIVVEQRRLCLWFLKIKNPFDKIKVEGRVDYYSKFIGLKNS